MKELISDEEEEDVEDNLELNLNQQISEHIDKNTRLEGLLRNCKEKIHTILKENEDLQKKNELFVAQNFKPEKKESEDFEIQLRQRIDFLESKLAKTKVKYKLLKKNTKKEKLQAQSEAESTSEQSFNRKFEEEIPELKLMINDQCKQIQQLTEENHQIKIKLSDSLEMVKLCSENAVEKEKFLSSFKSEANKKINEVLECIKFAGKKFNLSNTLLSDENWEIEEKLDNLPILIRNLYENAIKKIVLENQEDDVLHDGIADPLETNHELSAEFLSKLLNEAENDSSNANEIIIQSGSSVNPSSEKVIKRKIGFPGINRTTSFDPSIKERDLQELLLSARRGSLLSKETISKRNCGLTVKKDVLENLNHPENLINPYFPSILRDLGDFSDASESVENNFALISLAIKSDKPSLQTRIDDQRKMKYLDERDMLRNVETLSEFILRMKNRNNTRNTNSNKVEKMENHLKIMKLSIGRCAAAAESFGVLQIELKIKKHISVVLRHISENLRFNYEKHRRELEELKTFLDDFSDPDKSKNDVDRNNFSANSMKILSASGMEIIEDVNCNFNVLSSQSSDVSLEQIENSNEDLDGKTVGDLPLAIANTQEDKDEEDENDSVYEFNVELSNPEAWMKSLREMDIFFLLIFVSLVLYLLGVSILYK